MKKLIFIPLLLVISIVLAQSGKWKPQATEFSNNLYGLSFTDSLTGWICGENGLMLHTTDGDNWNQQPTPVTVNLYDVFFLDSLNGWACGDSGVILKTINAGEIWELLDTPINDRRLVSIEFTVFNGFHYGYSVGDTVALGTPDGGQTWYGGNTPIMFYDVTFWDPYNGFRACFLTPYEMQCTEDFGNTWEWVGIFEYIQYGIIRKDSAEFSWPLNCWTVGNFGTAYYNIYPGGGYWFYPAQTPDTLDLYEGDVDEIDTTIWAVGELGEIIYSTDFGVSYQKYPSPTSYNLYDVEFSGKETGWAVGDSGTILKYSGEWIITNLQNGLIQGDEINIQVAPNPFTEKVSIDISLIYDEYLSLSVYDLNGILINNLYSGVMKKGFNEIIWDGTNNNGQQMKRGVYVIKFLSGKKIITYKTLKK